jgi:hypothetical protein
MIIDNEVKVYRRLAEDYDCFKKSVEFSYEALRNDEKYKKYFINTSPNI